MKPSITCLLMFRRGNLFLRSRASIFSWYTSRSSSCRLKYGIRSSRPMASHAAAQISKNFFASAAVHTERRLMRQTRHCA